MLAVDGIDQSVWQWMIDHRSPPLTTFFKGVTTLCNPLTVVVVTTIVGLALLRFRHQVLTMRLVATVSTAWLTSTALKLLVHRARPPVAQRLIIVGEYSFPSGHATQSIALWTSLTLVGLALAHTRPSSARVVRPVAIVLAAAIAFAVGISRLYLGVHWFTDVVAGWIIGATWCVAWWRVSDDRLANLIRSSGRLRG